LILGVLVVIVAITLAASPRHPEWAAVNDQVLQAKRAQEQAWLHSYGWVDEAAGVVHIPIERAMELVVARAAEVGD
jgi:hypothetical protein